MDLFAVAFSLIILVLSVYVTHQCGIKPAREAKRRRELQRFAELREQHDAKVREEHAPRAAAMSKTRSGVSLSRQSTS